MKRWVHGVLAAVILLGHGCGDDETPFSPTVETVAGTYHPETLTATEQGITVNLLQLGSSLTLVLNPDGTTTGRLFAPGLGENGGDVDEDLAGTWSLDGTTVTFDHPGDTFIEDVPFTAEPNRLRGEGTFRGVRVALVLSE
jgi:hypothetical protein